MSSIYKVLGQVAPSAGVLTSLYTVPSATSAICSTLAICNQGVATPVRVAVRPAGEAIAAKHYIVYDQGLDANDSLFLTIGVSLSTTDVVSVYAGTATVSFSLFGTELS